MIPALIAAKSFIGIWWKAALGFILAAPLFFMLGQCDGKKIGRQQMRTAIAEANTRFLDQKARADALAADRRLDDTITVNRHEQELRNAIASTPDSAPDAARIALGCARLRANGTSEAAIPTVCRPRR